MPVNPSMLLCWHTFNIRATTLRAFSFAASIDADLCISPFDATPGVIHTLNPAWNDNCLPISSSSGINALVPFEIDTGYSSGERAFAHLPSFPRISVAATIHRPASCLASNRPTFPRRA